MRLKRTTDTAAVAALAVACFPGENAFRDGDVYWIGYEDGQPVAFCIAKKKRRVCDLVLAGVIKPYRGKGLQRQLIACREKWARSHNCKMMRTYVAISNGPSLATLIKAGYRVVAGEQDGFVNVRKQL